MNKVQCHNCLSSKRQFYVYTTCRHLLCLKCTFCLVNLQSSAIRCCYQYTPISEQLKQILDQQIKVRLNTSQNQSHSEYHVKSDISFKAKTIQPNKKYFMADSIKQQQSDERVNINIQAKPSKIQSIYIKDPYINNTIYSPQQRSSPQKFKNIYKKEKVEQKKQKIQNNTQVFSQNLVNINLQIQRQKEIIHQSFQEYHQELNLRQKQVLHKLYQVKENIFKNTGKTLYSENMAQQKQNLNFFSKKSSNPYHLTDKITSKLDHFKNILKERLIKHYI